MSSELQQEAVQTSVLVLTGNTGINGYIYICIFMYLFTYIYIEV